MSDGFFISRSFSHYWRADAVSVLGTYVTLFSLQALVVFTLEGTPSDVGWLNASRWLPYLVFGLVIGALVDGRRRLPLMIGTDLVQAVLLLSVPLLWWLDALSLGPLLVIVFLYGTAAVVNMAATMSFLPRLVPRDQLQPAHARIDGADAVGSMAGPAIGGVLASTIGAPLAVLVDSLTYLYSALTLRRIDTDEPPARTGVTVRGLLGDIIEGVRWAYGRSGLRTLAIATHGWFVGNAVVGVVLAPYARALELSPYQFGLVGAVGGVGAVVGATITTAVGRRLGTGRTIILCHSIITCGVVAMVVAGEPASFAGAIALLMLGQGLYGLAMGMSNSHEMSYRQLVTPDELQARTNTTLRAINRAVIVVVAPIAGLLADAVGIRPMLVVAAVTFALVASGLAATSFRNVRAPV
ncbi:MFS transporter [Nocardioides glacieisoli]|uniref:MFS transporter n=1 Tax=Nocardioides glacieisoli TaxID=1168730 RepID=A0A4Q2RSB1_9ACTN|nr:MFS transporter [Nocardioides glacieisoli]RYB90659.1 MFS transporter [Nocardioides glacieisoli]